MPTGARATVWQALRRRDYLAGWWPLRAAAYLASGVLLAVTALVLLSVLAVIGSALAVLLVGLPMLVGLLLSGIPIGAVERSRLRLVDSRPVGNPHLSLERPGALAFARARFGELASWRELCYVGLLCLLLWPTGLAALAGGIGLPVALFYTSASLLTGLNPVVRPLPGWSVQGTWPALGSLVLAAVLLPAGCYLVGVVAAVHARLARLLLGAREPETSARLAQLTSSRSRFVAAFEAERRRLERDLHDGAQQRLVALNMTLGLARSVAPGDVEPLLLQAQQELAAAMRDLRDLIQGIHPRLLTDRGLAVALADLADRSSVPVTLSVDLPGRLPDPVEAAAYFVVCEALVNVARHSGADEAWVSGMVTGSELRIEVRDDGCGGAVEADGSGLAGLRDRLAVLDGSLRVLSPVGGPTQVRMSLPLVPGGDMSPEPAQRSEAE
ncbi:sensor domain-containing protein [Frankia sp. Ag45/Mut15]|uniref:histidine kinase n=1 Tax=Frankia umida TaxID=573489 RepID=A0ABT0K2V4_9ACTN|nr:sensor histidine kinase [Frankia umida]MCK9877827.1 sensor domain-containing protein [Frankia umida]